MGYHAKAKETSLSYCLAIAGEEQMNTWLSQEHSHQLEYR